MGASYYAYTVIGCEVTDKIRTKEIVGEGCAHNPPSYQAFCPSCGKPRRIERWLNVPSYDSDREEITHAGNTLKVITTTDDKRLFAGVAVGVNHQNVKNDEGARLIVIQPSNLSAAPTFDDVVEQVQRVLQPLGLWDERAFGIWCVQRCAY